MLVNVTGYSPSTTFSLTTTDTAAAFATAKKHLDGTTSGRKARRCFITVENAPIRIAFGTAPTQAGLGKVVNADGSIELDSWAEINDFQYISKNNGVAAKLQVTMEF